VIPVRRITTLLLPLAALVYVIAWLTPVVDGGTTLAEGNVPGWEAFRVALSPVWPDEGLEVSTWYWAILTVSSALTNVVFVAALAHLVWRPRIRRRAVAWALEVAFVVNCSWLISGDREYLRLGYYLWVASFALLALAAWFPAAREPTPSAAAAA
jgi:hypothetical protein